MQGLIYIWADIFFFILFFFFFEDSRNSPLPSFSKTDWRIFWIKFWIESSTYWYEGNLVNIVKIELTAILDSLVSHFQLNSFPSNNFLRRNTKELEGNHIFSVWPTKPSSFLKLIEVLSSRNIPLKTLTIKYNWALIAWTGSEVNEEKVAMLCTFTVGF